MGNGLKRFGTNKFANSVKLIKFAHNKWPLGDIIC